MSIYKAIYAAIIGSMLIGCTGAEHDAPTANQKKTIQTKEIFESTTLTTEEKSELLAISGEELFLGNPLAFMFADEILKDSLKLDSKNKRAQFYRSLIGYFTVYKGILTRIKPLANRNTEDKANYERRLLEMKNEIPERLYDYLTAGVEDIRDEKSIQAFLGEITQSYDNIRTFMKNNKDLGISIHIPLTFATAVINDPKLCDFKQLPNGTIDYIECTGKQKSQRALEAADVEGIQHMFAMMQVYTVLMNTYDVTGSIELAELKRELEKNKQDTLPAEAQYHILAKNNDFGVLRNNNAFKQIRDMGVDGIKGVRMALNDQKRLCRNTVPDFSNPNATINPPKDGNWMDYQGQDELPKRPGKLFEEGFCVSERSSEGELTTDILDRVEKALFGEIITKTYTERKNWTEKTMRIKPAALIENPIVDLKTLKPKFNACNSVVQVSDNTLNGAIVDGNYNEYLNDTQDFWCDYQY